MSAPQLRLPIQSVHFDSAGIPVVHDQPYELEWLRRNYTTNGGFENWTSGTDADNWTEAVTGDGLIGKGTAETQAAHSGSESLCLKTSSGAGTCTLTSGTFRINPAELYRISAWVLRESGATLGIPKIYIDQFDASMNAVGTSPNLSASHILVPDVTVWHQQSRIIYPFEFSSSAVYAQIRIYVQFGAAQNKKWFLDDLILTHYNPDLLETFTDTLNQDSEETFTFPGYPLVGSVFDGEDDPSQDIESISGHLRIEQDRYPRREMSIKLRLTTKESLKQLRRFHAKTRGLTFTYVDHEGVSHSVRWRGGFSASPMQTNTNIYVVTLPLVLATVTNGA